MATRQTTTAASRADFRTMASDGEDTVRGRRIPELMAADIRRRILVKELAPGHALPPEAEMMAQYGVSRPSLREALRLLESERLIVVRRGKGGGAIIRAPDLDQAARQLGFVLQDRGVTLGDVHRARTIIEPPALAPLAATATPTQLAYLEGRLVECANVVGDPERYRSASGAVREKMVEMTGAVTATLIMQLLRDLLETQIGDDDFTPERLDKLNRASLKAHQRLFELITAGDPAAVESFWKTHLSEAGVHIERRATNRPVDLSS
jgi:DNA-binding FadR family transcriptional regulator